MSKTAIKEHTNGQLTADEMRQALAENEAAQMQACAAKIDAALQEFGFVLWAKPQFTDDGRTVAIVQLRPK